MKLVESEGKIQPSCSFPAFLMGFVRRLLRRFFSRYGDISDVYMGTKKDVHRKNFAFVRFKGVDDEMRLQNSL